MTLLSCVVASLAVVSSTGEALAPQCKRFDQIYASGKELCENMWNDAFVYEEDESKAYTMWFFDKSNPNDATSRGLGLLSGKHDTCHLDYYHKDTPGPEPENFTECHPWKENACCVHGTVETADKLKEGYGAQYHWDRCGPLTPECERFFVQESCFYECDPNAGLFRKWNTTVYDARCDAGATGYDKAHATAQGCSHNAWQMHKMPIKASYCDAWLTACASDNFCASDSGDFFTCATEYKAVDDAQALLEKQKLESQAALAKQEAAMKKALEKEVKERQRLNAEIDELQGDRGLAPALVAVVVALAIVASLALCVAVYLVRMERSGNPVFGKLLEEAGGKGQQGEGNGATIGSLAPQELQAQTDQL